MNFVHPTNNNPFENYDPRCVHGFNGGEGCPDCYELFSCDGCDRKVPRSQVKTVACFSDRCEGDFCHECRHGRDCDCGEGGD